MTDDQFNQIMNRLLDIRIQILILSFVVGFSFLKTTKK